VTESTAAALLQCRSVTRRFGGVHAVEAVDLTVAARELVAVIGPNGAGKTTLFNMIAGQDRPDAGSIAFDGHRIDGRPPERIAAAGIARTFQHGRVFANLSVLDNVLVGATTRLPTSRNRVPVLGALGELAVALLRGRAEDIALRRDAEEVLALFGDRLLPRLHHPAHSLSYANRRRVEIARALMLRPKLLLLDEPTAGMNETETAEMSAIVGALKRRGQSILLIEHKLDLVMALADRVIAMDDGRVIAAGTPDAVRHDAAVIEAYLGSGAVGHAAEPVL